MIIYETLYIPTRGELQDFIQSSKSFWSCTHVNSFQKYALYVNLHILLNISSKNNPRYPRIKKIHQMIEKITRIDQQTKSLCLVIT